MYSDPRTALYITLWKSVDPHITIGYVLPRGKKQSEIKVSVSKRILKKKERGLYILLETVRNIRRRNFNSSLIVDSVLGNVNIALYFENKLYTLFNSVQSLETPLHLDRNDCVEMMLLIAIYIVILSLSGCQESYSQTKIE